MKQKTLVDLQENRISFNIGKEPFYLKVILGISLILFLLLNLYTLNVVINKLQYQFAYRFFISFGILYVCVKYAEWLFK